MLLCKILFKLEYFNDITYLSIEFDLQKLIRSTLSFLCFWNYCHMHSFHFSIVFAFYYFYVIVLGKAYVKLMWSRQKMEIYIFRRLLIAKIRLFPSLRYKKHFLFYIMEMVGIIVARLNNPVIFVRVKFKKLLQNVKFTNVKIILTLCCILFTTVEKKIYLFPI